MRIGMPVAISKVSIVVGSFIPKWTNKARNELPWATTKIVVSKNNN